MSAAGKFLLIMLPIIIIFLSPNYANAEINVTLESPQDNYIFNSTNNVTFNCSASVDKNLESISLCHSINGSFDLNATKDLGQIDPDSDTKLLFHFNNDSSVGENETHVYDWSGNSNNGTVYNSDINSTGQFYKAIELYRNLDYIEVESPSDLDLTSQGSIELWVNIRSWTGGGTTPFQVIVSKVGTSCADAYTIWAFDGDFILDIDYWNFDMYSNSPISANQWYHLVTTWNGTEVRMYINGTLDNSASQTYSPPSIESSIFIGSQGPSCSPNFYFNGTLDELVIYDRVLSEEEVTDHYSRQLINSTSANWTFTDVTDGSYSWNCLSYDNESVSNWSSSNYTVSFDLQTYPSVNSIPISPNSSDDLDPGVTVNVTANITDISNVSYAILQYKECLGCSWINSTMTNISNEEWNTSFTTVTNERTYYYRIWSNDTLGHSGYSNISSVNITLDYSWTMNSSNLTGIKQGFIDTINELGLLVINNTGDDTIVFTLSDDWYLDVYYNGSGTYQFSLENKTIEHINITAMFEDHDNENNLTINILAEPSDPSKTAEPEAREVNATLNSYTGGPYFSVVITAESSIAYQSGTLNMTAKLKNIGNESSSETWLNWTLPSGWSVTSGNISNNISVLAYRSTYWSKITVYIDPNVASVGTHIIYANVTCNESVNGSDSEVIGVECSSDGVCGEGCSYVTDSDCTSLSGGGSNPVISSLTKDYYIVLDMPARYDINRGETGTLNIGVENPVENTVLKNVYLSLSGYPQTFMTISPSSLEGIETGETGYFEVEIKAPVYALYRKYDLIITVVGNFTESGKSTSAEQSSSIVLITRKLIQNETLGYFERAGKAFEEMANLGFETLKIKAMLEEIEKELDNGNYEKAKYLSEEVIRIRDISLEINTQIEEIDEKLESVKVNNLYLPETEKMVFLAKSAFERGEYDRSEERMENALLIYTIEMGGASFWLFIYGYWWLITMGVVILGAGSVIARRKLILRSLTKILDQIAYEEREIRKLIENLQKDHFIKRKIGADSYYRNLESYEQGLIDIKKKRVGVLTKITRMLKKSKALEKFRLEEANIRSVMTELQNDYFRLGKIGRRYYDKTMEGLKWELLEIEKGIEMIESGGNV